MVHLCDDIHFPLLQHLAHILIFFQKDGVREVLRQERNGQHPVEIVEEETNGRLSLGAGTLYGALNTLQEKGWIRPCGNKDGRKKEYEITQEGKSVAETELQRLHSLVGIAEKIMGGTKI